MHLKEGNFELDLKLVKLGAKLAEDDRQCAWELYTEMSTRVAVVGKLDDPSCENFDGEIYIESLSSLYSYFQEARGIMRKFPVGRLSINKKNHLGVLIHRMMRDVLRPFLETWQGQYRHWWEYESDPKLPPFKRQEKFPQRQAFLKDWADVRALMRSVQEVLIDTYKLVDIAHDER